MPTNLQLLKSSQYQIEQFLPARQIKINRNSSNVLIKLKKILVFIKCNHYSNTLTKNINQFEFLLAVQNNNFTNLFTFHYSIDKLKAG